MRYNIMAGQDKNQAVSGLDAQALADLRARLEAERERLLGMVATEEENTSASAPEDPLTADVQDYGEQGFDLTQEDIELALEDNDRRQLAQVEKALRRMAEGTYGLSEVSGKPIPLERLEVLPWATTNVGE
jgi:DnaK suppressor protein